MTSTTNTPAPPVLAVIGELPRKRLSVTVDAWVAEVLHQRAAAEHISPAALLERLTVRALSTPETLDECRFWRHASNILFGLLMASWAGIGLAWAVEVWL